MKELDTLSSMVEQQAHKEPAPGQVMYAAMAQQEQEYDQIKQLYPAQLAQITGQIEELCDQLEYEGSPMFHEVLDAVTVQQLAQNIYRDMTDEEDVAVSCMAWKPDSRHAACRDGHCEPPYVPDCDHGNCMLRQMIEVLLLNEMQHRRNRYRCRHCGW